jgi:hypothetical protein
VVARFVSDLLSNGFEVLAETFVISSKVRTLEEIIDGG